MLTYYTAQEVADILKVNVHTVYRLVRKGDLPYVRWSAGGNIRIRRDDLDVWLEVQRSRGQANDERTS